MLGEYSPRAEAAGGGTDDRSAGAPGGVPGRARAPRSGWRDPAIWAVATAVFCAYSLISVLRLLRFDPASYDLAIYTEYVKQLSQLHAPVVDVLAPGYNLLGNHFQVAVAVLAPFFRVFPSPATLLIGQAALTAVSVFPVAEAASVFAGRAAGRLTGLAYGFSWGLQQMINSDFHEIALAVPLLAFSVSALVRRRPWAAIGWAMPLVFVEESQGFTVAAIGLVLGLSAAFPPPWSGGWRARVPFRAAGFGTGPDGRYVDGRWGDGRVALWGGLFLMAWGLFWSVLAITVIIPHFSPAHDYYFFKDGGVVGGGQSFSLGGVIGQTAAHWPVKLATTLLLLLPTAFAALGSPAALAALPSLGLRFVSVNSAYWGTAWHYNATVMPILFIAAAETAGRLRGWPSTRLAHRVNDAAPALARALGPARRVLVRHAGAAMAAIAVVLAFHFPLSDLWHGATYRLGPHVAAADAALATVPDGVTVQSTLDMLAPLAARTDAFWIGTPGNPLTQYVVFDNDDSGYSITIGNVRAFIAMLYPHDGYVQIFDRDGIYVFRRG